MPSSYYNVELIQTDPVDSPTPGCAHYAGGPVALATAQEALSLAIDLVGKPVQREHFHPCCDFQKPETVVTAAEVLRVDDGGRVEDTHVAWVYPHGGDKHR